MLASSLVSEEEEAMLSGICILQGAADGGVKLVVASIPLMNIMIWLDYTPTILGTVTGHPLMLALNSSVHASFGSFLWLWKFISDIANNVLQYFKMKGTACGSSQSKS